MSIFSVFIAIVGLGILAAFHEIGHFLVARRLNIKVEELSIFVGPKLVGWTRKGVKYTLRLIPFGAYVKFVGVGAGQNIENEAEFLAANPDSYFNQPRWKRLLVSLAGPGFNFVLGMLIFFIVFAQFGFSSMRLSEPMEKTQLYTTDLKEGDLLYGINGARVYTDFELGYFLYQADTSKPISIEVKEANTGAIKKQTLEPKIFHQYLLGVMVENKPAAEGLKIVEVDKTGNKNNPVLKKGDILVKVNGVGVLEKEYSNVIEDVSSLTEDFTVDVEILREGQKMELEMYPQIKESANPRGVYLLPGKGFKELAGQSFFYTFSVVRVSVLSLKDAFSGNVPANEVVSGPLGIVNMVSDIVDQPTENWKHKAETLLTFAGFISVALAFSNLLPLPGLDGSAIILVAVEMIRGKKLSLKTETIINAVGFVILISLVIFALFSDISRIIAG